MTQSTLGVQEPLTTFRFNFDQFERMFAEGVLKRSRGGIQLLDGQLVEMTPTSDPHGIVSAELAYQLHAGLRAAGLRGELDIRTHSALKLDSFSAPEPDVDVVKHNNRRPYATAPDAVLVIEVSLSTQETDASRKSPLYARAGIPELWIVEPEARRVRVFRDPRPDGSWGDEAVVTEGAVTPLFSDQVRVDLADLF